MHNKPVSKSTLQHKGQLTHLLKTNHKLRKMREPNVQTNYPTIEWAKSRRVPPRTAGHTQHSKAYTMARNSSIQQAHDPATKKKQRRNLALLLGKWRRNNRRSPIQRNGNMYYNAISETYHNKYSRLPIQRNGNTYYNAISELYNPTNKFRNERGNSLPLIAQQTILNKVLNPIGEELERRPKLRTTTPRKTKQTKKQRSTVRSSRVQSQELQKHLNRLAQPLSQKYRNQIRTLSSK